MALFTEFESAGLKSWEKQALEGLRGANIDSLNWSYDPAVITKPYYDQDDLVSKSPVHLGRHRGTNNWTLIEPLRLHEATNSNAIEALNLGATGVLVESENIDISKIDQILPEHCWLGVSVKEDAVSGVVQFIEFLKSRNADPNQFHGLFGSRLLDEAALLKGDFMTNASTLAEILRLTQDFPNIKTLDIRSDLFHNRGAAITQELAFTLALVEKITDSLIKEGIDVVTIAKKLQVTVAVGTDFYHEIAKIRAIRLLLFKFFAAYGVEISMGDFFILGVTSDLSQTVLDIETNYLRKSTQAMSCVLGGVDGLMITPFDTAAFDSTNRRICRNIGNILRDESSLHYVADPTSGAYFVESLTERIAAKSWQEFSKIMLEGGWENLTKTGALHQALHASFERTKEQVLSRKKIILGVNNYPNPQAKFTHPPKNGIPGYATDFENLHAIISEYNKRNQNQVKWQPILVGENGAFQSARLNFSANFLGCAGLAAKDPIHLDKMNDLQEETLLVLCGSDEDYELLEEDVVKELAARGKLLCIAGQPPNVQSQLIGWGVDIFIHRKAPIYATLVKILEFLDIKITN